MNEQSQTEAIKPTRPITTKVNILPRHRKLFKEIIEKGRKQGEAMRELGYAENTANRPTKVKKTQSWQALMDEKLKDEELLKVHREGLKANKIEWKQIGVHPVNKRPIFKKLLAPDNFSRLKSVELGYKIKGKLIEKHAVAVGIAALLEDENEA